MACLAHGRQRQHSVAGAAGTAGAADAAASPYRRTADAVPRPRGSAAAAGLGHLGVFHRGDAHLTAEAAAVAAPPHVHAPGGRKHAGVALSAQMGQSG